MRIVCHAQFLTGVGHLVRMRRIAAGLAGAHEVYLVDGNRPIPRPRAAEEPKPIPLPILARDRAGRLVGAHGAPAGPVLRQRTLALTEAVTRIRPDAFLVDHYPFGRWELETEITAAIEAARRAHAGVQVWCSVRDLVPTERFQPVGSTERIERVLGALDRHFDGVLVHSDPAFARLGDTFAGADAVPVPVRYTGFVTEAPAPEPPGIEGPWAVVSAGGTSATPFLTAAVRAFADRARAGATGDTRLHVFQGPDDATRDADELRRAADGASIELHSFSPHYDAYLSGAAFSISRAGYNTSTALLRTRVPALVVPNPRLTDQPARATRLAAAGLALTVDGEYPAPSALAATLDEVIGTPRPHHGFDLDGVGGTRRIVETWGSAPPSVPVA